MPQNLHAPDIPMHKEILAKQGSQSVQDGQTSQDIQLVPDSQTLNNRVSSLRREMREGFETAYIDGGYPSNLALQPSFVSNDPEQGRKVISSVEDELLRCDSFAISVAFITMGGITPLLQTLKELEEKGIPGEILTTNYLDFSEPKALSKLNSLKNVSVRMYDAQRAENGFHTKGYIFRKQEIYRIIIGSSNLTSAALTCNREWNTKLVSTEQGEVAAQILQEFQQLWNSEYTLDFDSFYEMYRQRYEIVRHQRMVAAREPITSLERYRLKPNSMQVQFISNLRSILQKGETRALLISATGTGKTYASAFAMRELGFRRVLFLVHRGQLARQTKKAYQNVFGNTVTMGLVGGGVNDPDEYGKDYIFATVQTLSRDEHLFSLKPDAFDCIILDEAHHTTATTYQKIMKHFHPRLFLGMTATPDRREDEAGGQNVYELFHYQIALEIRLQQAMEERLLCPFHYFGISEITNVDERELKARRIDERDFNRLTSDDRVHHILEQASYYGYSGDRVKGLIFCSRVDEARELSRKFNERGYRTIALSGDSSDGPGSEREEAFERLAMDEAQATPERQPLDYIFSVSILNEGVDIVEVNQVIMLRPTQSPIVFIQQLGRGLRKAEGKEYTVILDFIGNYQNNFMIPVALSGDRSYNPDVIRKYVISGNSTIPGASTVHFDEVAREKIFRSIDRIRGMKTIISESYISLKSRLGRVPLLMDFYENGEVDPLVIIHEFKTYWQFLEWVERDKYHCPFSDQEKITLEYLSKTILSGVRPDELEILRELLETESVSEEHVQEQCRNRYGRSITKAQTESAELVLEGHFVTKADEYEKRYRCVELIRRDDHGMIFRLESFTRRLSDAQFRQQLTDIIRVGLARYRDTYQSKQKEEGVPFVLYEQYSRRDVSLLMNCGKDLSSVMFGMKRIGDDAFVFITYHKQEATDEKNYVDGKPDYADAFEDNMTFRWDSKIGMDRDSAYMKQVSTAPRRHLMVKKSDAQTSFYYMGQFDILSAENATKEDNSGHMKPITKVVMRMHHPVRDDLLRYLQSEIEE